jgi:hypothetical protein
VYYLAKSIDESLISTYELTRTFDKKKISNNVKPRNVYEKALSVAEEFDHIHRGALDRTKLQAAYSIDTAQIRSADVYNILGMIRDYLMGINSFHETTETKTPKRPGDVFHMLRQLSLHHTEIAEKKNIQTNWGTSGHVYQAVVTEITPAIMAMADEMGFKYDKFPFPRQPITGVIPRYVYKLLYQTYVNISKLYTAKKRYEPIVLEQMNDCDEISPSDVFNLVQIIAAEFKAESGNKALDPEMENRYTQWKNGKEKILPGDVFRLIQYNFILSKHMLETN